MSTSINNIGVHEDLFFNLKVLGFVKHHENVLKAYPTDYKGLEFNEQMFYRSNPKAFQVVAHFLINKNRNEPFSTQIRPCFPCRDRKQEADFRKIVTEFINALQKESKDEIYGGKLPVMATLQHAGGDAFTVLFLAISNYVLLKRLSKVDKSAKRIFSNMANEDVEAIIENDLKIYEENMAKRNDIYKRIHESGQSLIDRHRLLKEQLAKAESEFTRLATEFTGSSLEGDVQLEDIKQFYVHLLSSLKALQNSVTSSRAAAIIDNMSLDSNGDKVVVLHDHDGDDYEEKLNDYKKAMRAYDQFLLNDSNGKLLSESESILQNTEKQIENLTLQLSQLQSTHKQLLVTKEAKERECAEAKRILLENEHLKQKLSSVKHLFPSRMPVIEFKPVKPLKTRPRVETVEAITKPEPPVDTVVAPVKTEEESVVMNFDISVNFADESSYWPARKSIEPCTASPPEEKNEKKGSSAKNNNFDFKDIADESLPNISF